MQRLSLVACTLLIIPAVLGIPAQAANEKGPRCSDGIDNDGDGAIDGDDPDCNGGQSNLPSLVLTDESGAVIGVPIRFDTRFDAVALQGADRAVVGWIDANNEIYGDPVYFTGAVCSGDAYIPDPDNPYGHIAYDFMGECEAGGGCTGTATGTLWLTNTYVPGTELTDADFVSFEYSSSSGQFNIPGDQAFSSIRGVLPAMSGPSVEWISIDAAGDGTGINICSAADPTIPAYCPSAGYWYAEFTPNGITQDTGLSHNWQLRIEEPNGSVDQVLMIHGVTGQFYVSDLAAAAEDFTAASVLSSQGCDVESASFSGATRAVTFPLTYTPPVKAEVR